MHYVNIEDVAKLVAKDHYTVLMIGSRIYEAIEKNIYILHKRLLCSTLDQVKRLFMNNSLIKYLIELTKYETLDIHDLISNLVGKGFIDMVITTCIDGFLPKVIGSKVIEVLGNIRRFTCVKCGSTVDLNEALNTRFRCLRCSNFLRPKVLLKDEGISKGVWSEVLMEISMADVLLICGLDIIEPIAYLPIVAKFSNAKVIEVLRKGEECLFCDYVVVTDDFLKFFKGLVSYLIAS